MRTDDKEMVVEKIRAQYEEKSAEEKKLDTLKKMDAEVKRPVNLFAYVFGTAGSLVMGTGMCLAMDVLGEKKRIPGVLLSVRDFWYIMRLFLEKRAVPWRKCLKR